MSDFEALRDRAPNVLGFSPISKTNAPPTPPTVPTQPLPKRRKANGRPQRDRQPKAQDAKKAPTRLSAKTTKPPVSKRKKASASKSAAQNAPDTLQSHANLAQDTDIPEQPVQPSEATLAQLAAFRYNGNASVPDFAQEELPAFLVPQDGRSFPYEERPPPSHQLIAEPSTSSDDLWKNQEPLSPYCPGQNSFFLHDGLVAGDALFPVGQDPQSSLLPDHGTYNGSDETVCEAEAQFPELCSDEFLQEHAVLNGEGDEDQFSVNDDEIEQLLNLGCGEEPSKPTAAAPSAIEVPQTSSGPPFEDRVPESSPKLPALQLTVDEDMLSSDPEEISALMALSDKLSSDTTTAQTTPQAKSKSKSTPQPPASPLKRAETRPRKNFPILSTTPKQQNDTTQPRSAALEPNSSTTTTPTSHPPLPQPPLSPLSPTTPFVRPPHPPPMSRHSPIPGLSPQKRIQTCFRLGEAINASAAGTRAANPILVELYARVAHSGRDEEGQHFRFVDLWSGSGKGGLEVRGTWRGWREGVVGVVDSGRFLEGGLGNGEGERVGEGRDGGGAGTEGEGESGGGVLGKMCRVVGRLGRASDEEGGGWSVAIESLWEADWEDVNWVRGCVM